MTSATILVTGATGYVGGRLVPLLLNAGYHVKVTSRSLEKLRARRWANHPLIKIISFDAMDYQSCVAAMQGCNAAYYLIHSMNPQHKDFATADRSAAHNFARAAKQVGLQRIIYLGGLGEQEDQLSTHLRSRAEVANILRSGNVPVTVLRAAMIIGSGSASFESLRYLVDRLPVMITPRWVSTPSQPIAISDVLFYLTECLKEEKTAGVTFDIGGPEVLSYRSLMEIYAQVAGLPKPLIIPVPVFTPKLSSYWIHLITPVPAYIAQPLADGLRNPAICKDFTIQLLLPHNLMTCREAIRLALMQLKEHQVETHWTDAGIMDVPEWKQPHDVIWAGGTTYEDRRCLLINVPAHQVWNVIARIGGQNGWYYANWLWRLRGFIDLLIGGAGLRRGRRHPVNLLPGDALDFWRVVRIESGKDLLLQAEMKLPGKASLEFRLSAISKNQTQLEQIAHFVPSGLLGILYWKLLLPLHTIVFNGMLHSIARRAQVQSNCR